MKVSALITTYNRRKYVFRAIESVLAQTVPVDEIIVIDDGSTDGTAEGISARFDSLVRVVRQQNTGLGGARKRGVEEAKGEWVAFLDDDDEWMPDRNELLLQAASQVPPEVAWIFGDAQLVTDDNHQNTIYGNIGLVVNRNPRVIHDPLSELVWRFDVGRPTNLPSGLIRRSALLQLRCFSECLRHSEDLLAGLQMASCYSFAAIPTVVTKVYRTSDLARSSLEFSGRSSEDHYQARLTGYALAARTAGHGPWSDFFADSVRGLCKCRAADGLPIRKLALEQFRFGTSFRSIAFFGAALLGPRFFQAVFLVKRTWRAHHRKPKS